MVGGADDEDEADRKEGRENDAHGGTLVNLAKLGDPLSEESREDADDGRADEHREAGARPSQQEGGCEPGEDGVADGVAHHAHAAQDEEAARDRRRDCGEGADDDDPVIEGGPVHFSG